MVQSVDKGVDLNELNWPGEVPILLAYGLTHCTLLAEPGNVPKSRRGGMQNMTGKLCLVAPTSLLIRLHEV